MRIARIATWLPIILFASCSEQQSQSELAALEGPIHARPCTGVSDVVATFRNISISVRPSSETGTAIHGVHAHGVGHNFLDSSMPGRSIDLSMHVRGPEGPRNFQQSGAPGAPTRALATCLYDEGRSIYTEAVPTSWPEGLPSSHLKLRSWIEVGALGHPNLVRITYEIAATAGYSFFREFTDACIPAGSTRVGYAPALYTDSRLSLPLALTKDQRWVQGDDRSTCKQGWYGPQVYGHARAAGYFTPGSLERPSSGYGIALLTPSAMIDRDVSFTYQRFEDARVVNHIIHPPELTAGSSWRATIHVAIGNLDTVRALDTAVRAAGY